MKIKKTTQDVIESTKFMIQYAENPQSVIEGICKSHRLTQDFIREFSQYITPEMFMTSYRLPKELAEANPSLYNEDDFKNLCKYKEEEITEDENEKLANKLNTMSSQMQGFMKQNGGNFITGGQLGQLASLLGDPDEPRKRITNNIKFLSVSMLALFYNEFKDNEEYKITHDDIKKILRDSTDEEMSDENIINLMGISAEIDELLLKRIKDEDTKNGLLLALSVSDDHQMTSSSYKHLSNDMKENMLGTEDVHIREFFNALSETKDLGWQLKMINQAANGEITFEKTNAVYEKELLMLVAAIPEDLVVKLTKLAKYAPNTFSYKIMTWLLQNRDFTEMQLIEMKDLFKKAGMYFILRKEAQDKGYNMLLEALKN